MKLLLAEDEKALSKALVTILRHENYTVDAVFNGEDALNYLLLGDYDGAILDIMMPKKDGITVLREFRAQNKSVPVLLLTAKADIDDKVAGLDSGADDYLGKPFDVKELLARLRAMMRRKQGKADNLLIVSDLCLDRVTFELRSPKGDYRLGNKEFQLIELLMSNAGKVIPTDTILSKIWGYDSDAESNVVWTYLSYLRKKLASLTELVTIEAVRGVGYVLVNKHV